MLFKVTRRYRTHDLQKTAEKYVLYLKWDKKGKHREFGRFETKDEAIKTYKAVSHQHQYISEDYRIRLVKQSYSEESVHVPSVKELMDEFPELKGTWKL